MSSIGIRKRENVRRDRTLKLDIGMSSYTEQRFCVCFHFGPTFTFFPSSRSLLIALYPPETTSWPSVRPERIS